jgi:8-oxo-dGTP pyrophosphatase MutT (NUDIX family)
MRGREVVNLRAPELRQLVPELLATPEPLIVDEAVDRRAAVTLVLSPDPVRVSVADALLVLRSEVEGDPWSGHVALPGGRAEEDDADLLRTAQRELEEETGVSIPRPDFLGRLDDLHPRSAHLPSIAVTPYVAWMEERKPLVENSELAGHVWVPVSELASPARRSSLVRELPVPRVFETIEISGYTVWGMTLGIIDNFLERLRRGSR